MLVKEKVRLYMYRSFFRKVVGLKDDRTPKYIEAFFFYFITQRLIFSSETKIVATTQNSLYVWMNWRLWFLSQLLSTIVIPTNVATASQHNHYISLHNQEAPGLFMNKQKRNTVYKLMKKWKKCMFVFLIK